jgi:uncharacterized protein (TIGR03067 family)
MLAAFTALSLIVAGAEPPKDKELTEAALKELKKFESQWKVVKIIASGTDLSPVDDTAVLIEFKGRKVVFKDKEVLEVATLDAASDPKCIALKALADVSTLSKGTVYEFIYKFDGETVVLAINPGEGKKRPEKFESAKDSGVVVVTLKREKK